MLESCGSYVCAGFKGKAPFSEAKPKPDSLIPTKLNFARKSSATRDKNFRTRVRQFAPHTSADALLGPGSNVSVRKQCTQGQEPSHELPGLNSGRYRRRVASTNLGTRQVDRQWGTRGAICG